MNMHKNSIRTVLTVTAVLAGAAICAFTPEIAQATRIETPGYVGSADVSQLNEAGATINTWIFALMAIAVAVSSVRPAWYFLNGNADEGWRTARDVIIGVVLALVMGGIAFSVANSAGS